jgi:hypothetical protein
VTTATANSIKVREFTSSCSVSDRCYTKSQVAGQIALLGVGGSLDGNRLGLFYVGRVSLLGGLSRRSEDLTDLVP